MVFPEVDRFQTKRRAGRLSRLFGFIAAQAAERHRFAIGVREGGDSRSVKFCFSSRCDDDAGKVNSS
jgi:hypothetical protein